MRGRYSFGVKPRSLVTSSALIALSGIGRLSACDSHRSRYSGCYRGASYDKESRFSGPTCRLCLNICGQDVVRWINRARGKSAMAVDERLQFRLRQWRTGPCTAAGQTVPCPRTVGAFLLHNPFDRWP